MNPIYTNTKNMQRSDKYQHVNTATILDHLTNRGFEITGTSLLKPRDKAKEGYQRHLVRLTHEKLTLDGNRRAELIVVNSHDGSTSLRFWLGVFEFLCANGLVTGDAFESYRFKHVGRSLFIDINEALEKLINVQVPSLGDRVKKMQSRETTFWERVKLSQEALKLRLGQDVFNTLDTNQYQSLITQVMQPRRVEEEKGDLWTVFNVIQENIVRGGLKYKAPGLNKNGEIIDRARQTRHIKDIERNTAINRALWNNAEDLLVA